MGQVVSIFATPLYVNKLQFGDDVVEYVDQLEYGNQIESYNSQSVQTDVLEHKELKGIRDTIEYCLSEYTGGVLRSNQTVSITQSWCNKTKKGTNHGYHHHPNSIVSGVLFIKSSPNCPGIKFYRPSVLPFAFSYESGSNEYVNDNYSYQSEPGILLLFPSNVAHSVDTNSSDVDRISLSFNTFVNDSLGDPRSLTHVTT